MIKPIIFSGPMVRQILAGRKSETRRLLYSIIRRGPNDPVPNRACFDRRYPPPHLSLGEIATLGQWQKLQPGDRLWVRENVRAEELQDGRDGVRYEADNAWISIPNAPKAADDWVRLNHYGNGPKRGRLVPCIHMPRWASRIWLDVAEIKIERLREISEAGARREGVERADAIRGWRDYSGRFPFMMDQRESFSSLWDMLHSVQPERWQDNPWVVVIRFNAHQGNVDCA